MTTADVVVVGAGNAALSAAIAAREAGAEVLVLEKAPYEERGGNSRFTGGLLRFAFADRAEALALVDDLGDVDADALDVPPYPVDGYIADVQRLCADRSDPALLRALAEGSAAGGALAVRPRRALRAVREVRGARRPAQLADRAMIKVRGGGEGLVAALFDAAEKAGVEIRYGAQVTGLDLDGRAVDVRTDGGLSRVSASAMVLGSGGFEANPAVARALPRASPGTSRRCAAPGTTPGEGSRTCWPPAPPRSATGPARTRCRWTRTPRTSAICALGAHDHPPVVPVRRDGQRGRAALHRRGRGLQAAHLRRIGREVLAQPRSRAFQIFDQKTVPLIEPRYALRAAPVVADTIAELADGLGRGRRRARRHGRGVQRGGLRR